MTKCELEEIAKKRPNKKAPGIDGFPAQGLQPLLKEAGSRQRRNILLNMERNNNSVNHKAGKRWTKADLSSENNREGPSVKIDIQPRERREY